MSSYQNLVFTGFKHFEVGIYTQKKSGMNTHTTLFTIFFF